MVLATGNVLPIAYALAYLIGTSGPVVAENGGLILHRGRVTRVSDPRAALRAHAAVQRRYPAARLFTDRWRVTEVAYPELPGTLAGVRRALADAGAASTVRVERTGFAVHLMDPHHSKFEGVRRALALIGVAPADALAVGDSDNDRSMIVGCGVGVAVGDASEGLKQGADFVARGRGGAGLWEAFARYGVAAPPRAGATGAARGARGRPTRGWRRPSGRAPRPPRRAPARAARRAPPARPAARRRRTRRS